MANDEQKIIEMLRELFAAIAALPAAERETFWRDVEDLLERKRT